MSEVDGARMASIYRDLNRGELVPTTDLRWFVHRAATITGLLERIPEFRLMVSDLLLKQQRVETMLDSRKTENYDA